MSWLYHRPDRGHARRSSRRSSRAARDRGGEHEGLQGGLELRRDLRGLRRLVRGRSGEARTRHVPPDLRKLGAHVRPDRGEQALRSPALPRRLPDHARLGRPRAAREPEAVRRPHVPGGGRDRGLGRRARSGVRRRARRDHLGRPGHRPEVGDGRARGDARAPAPDRGHPARRPLDGHADEAGAGRPARWSCSAGTRSRRCPSWPRRRPQAASTPRSRRRASRSSTARPSSCSRTRTSRTDPSRGASPTSSSLPDISTEFATEPNDGEGFLPYRRDAETLARPWAIPGTPGLEHRIGGLEKEDETGNVSYDPENHDLMVRLRAAKVAGHRGRHPRARGRRSRMARTRSSSAGARRTARSARRRDAYARTGGRSRPRTSTT